MDKNIFITNLRAYLKTREMKQKELAELLGVSARTIRRWFSGEDTPSTDSIVKIGKLLNIPLEYLLGIEIKEDKTMEKLSNVLVIVKDKDSEGFPILSVAEMYIGNNGIDVINTISRNEAISMWKRLKKGDKE